MSVLPRLAAGSLSVVLAFAVLGGPTAALAAPGPDAPGRPVLPSAAADAAVGAAGGAVAGRSAAAPSAGRPQVLPTQAAAAARQPRPTGSDAATPRDRRATPRGRSAQAPGRSAQAPGRSAEARKGAATGPTRKDARTAAGKGKAAGAAPGRSATSAKDGDPRGNNGTFKVDGPVLDTSHGNEPQVACAFRLNFFGYDAGQLADISFTAVAPTKGPTTTVTGRPVISTSAAKGGLYGGSFPATGTWTAGDLGLDPTVRQHVKVSVESVNADGSAVPGGAKHKVFWLEPCAAAATAGAASAPAASAPAVVEEPDAQPLSLADAPAAEAVTAAAPAPAAVTAAAAPGSAVLAAGVTAQAAEGPTVVAAPALTAIVLPQGSARTAVQPATLPFTGSPQLLALLLGGVVALAGGTALLVAVRRTA